MFDFQKFCFLFFIIAFCTGCRFGPDYRPPVVEVSDGWKHGLNDSSPVPFTGIWWEVFNDETLNSLEATAVLNNPNLFAALDRVAEARAVVGVDRAALYPQINLLPSYSNTGELIKLYIPTGLFPSTFTQANLNTPFRVHELIYNLPFTMSYELDLWGRLSGQYDSAILSAEAQQEDFNTSLLTLTADVATSYFQIRSFDRQVLVLQENIEELRKYLDLTLSRFNRGLANKLDVVSAQQQLTDEEAICKDIARQRALQENALAILVGVPPSELCIGANPLYDPPPQIPGGIPSEVLFQRPDIAAAERNMASEHALISVAYASFFPAIQLTGTFGFLSPTLKDFLQWKSHLWILGANAAQSIFDAGRNQWNLDLAYANFNEALHEYKDQVLIALREVEDALANLEWLYTEYQSYWLSSQSAKERLSLTLRRYVQGLASYLEVIDSRRTALQAELNEVNVLGERYISTVQLIKAMGGSWEASLQTTPEEPGCSSQCE